MNKQLTIDPASTPQFVEVKPDDLPSPADRARAERRAQGLPPTIEDLGVLSTLARLSAGASDGVASVPSKPSATDEGTARQGTETRSTGTHGSLTEVTGRPTDAKNPGRGLAGVLGEATG